MNDVAIQFFAYSVWCHTLDSIFHQDCSVFTNCRLFVFVSLLRAALSLPVILFSQLPRTQCCVGCALIYLVYFFSHCKVIVAFSSVPLAVKRTAVVLSTILTMACVRHDIVIVVDNRGCYTGSIKL